MDIPVFDESELRRLIDMPSAIDTVRRAFIALWHGAARVPVRTALADDRGSTLFMPGEIGGGADDRDHSDAALGIKVVAVRPANRGRGLPAIHAVILLLDPVTGMPRAVFDARWLTALRTGAATGVATDLLARHDATVLALVGAGAQARCQVEAVAAVRRLTDVRVASRGGVSARRLVDELLTDGVVDRARAVDDVGAAVRGADIVVTVTDSATPVVVDADIAAGTHVNAVGGYTTGMRELPLDLVGRARVVVDCKEAALAEAGDIVAPLDANLVSVAELCELGGVAAGDLPARRDPGQVTVFKSVGNAVQDLAVARLALDRAGL